jgi:GntR family transcriptional regulator / MocR family aminotransferase
MSRNPRTLELPITLETSGIPLHRALYDALRAAILDGRLEAGARLPATRDLARQLGIARGTVVAVFEQCVAEGYLATRVGAGTFVATELPDAWFRAQRAPAVAPRVPRSTPHFSSWARSLDAGSPFSTTAGRAARPFRAHIPALDVFPREEWGRLVARHGRQASASLLADCDVRGHRPLRAALLDHLRVARGVVASIDQIVITPSTQQALDLTARLVLDPGDRAWLEDPGYPGTRAVLEAAGAAIAPIPVDDRGLDVAQGIARAPDARLAYVTPAHQAPLGVTLSLDRRLTLLDWAAGRGAWIFEDDYDSEFRYEGRPLPALQGLDRAGVVVHAGSFSKTLFPALRLAYVVVPDALLDRFLTAKSIVDRYTPPFAQAVLAEFIAEGHFGRHLRRMRALYAERRAALLGALDAELGDHLEVIGASAGLELCAWLPGGVDDRSAVRALADAAIEAAALSPQALGPLARGGLQLGFAAFSPARLRKSVAAMRLALAPLLRKAAR